MSVLKELFGSSAPRLLCQDGTIVPASAALSNKRYVMLYISASWCPPCRSFTPKLAMFHERFNQQHSFEVVFVSGDRDEASMLAYYHNARHSGLSVSGAEGSHGNWFAVPYGEASKVYSHLVRCHNVWSIPTLLLFELETGKLVTPHARDHVIRNLHTAAGFPWEGVDPPAVSLQQVWKVVVVLIVLYLIHLVVAN
ncbi:putative tryparedoxin [Trypanosoma vivax]|uniref:Putative tryparedoxin n=2 Tax=Trypanosoma vivax (strain Y486) TaxID=1055687 RepID=G0TT53_TRYVY|nr:putative tryparedoxin [Trypanosoma vivax]CCC47134.1 putative tryparedoxin [Trypanosoma vivax Y486]